MWLTCALAATVDIPRVWAEYYVLARCSLCGRPVWRWRYQAEDRPIICHGLPQGAGPGVVDQDSCYARTFLGVN
jgi:hypothetical protein